MKCERRYLWNHSGYRGILKFRKPFGFLIGSLVLFSCGGSSVKEGPEDVSEEERLQIMSAPTSLESIQYTLEFLASDSLKGREAGSEGIEMAAQFIEKLLYIAKIPPYFETYRDTLTNYKKTSYNIIGWLPGNDPKLKKEFVVLGAHYDHIGFGKWVANDRIANGANDNASGTVAVLEIAKHFATTRNNKRSLLFVLFSAEEKGLKGSYHLSEKLKEQEMDIYTMINFEMIGVPLETKHYLAILTGYKRSNMGERFNSYAEREVVGFWNGEIQSGLFRRSDNYPFYLLFNVPSHTLFSFDFENYPYYHHVKDEASQMDYEHMKLIIDEMTLIIEKAANTEEREIILYD